MFGTSRTHAELLEGESVMVTKAANAVVHIDDYRLSPFVAGDFMALVGMAGQEAIGGRLVLTTYRLMFHAHAINRLRGSFSIFLPTIQAVHDVSSLLVKRIEVRTQTQRYEFVVWGRRRLLAAIEAAQSGMTPTQHDQLPAMAAAAYGLRRDGLQVAHWLETIHLGAQAVPDLSTLGGMVNSNEDVSYLLNLWELAATRDA